MHWNPDPVLLRLGGLTVFWYGFLFTAGLFCTVLMAHRIFRERGLEERHASNLTFWTIGGLFIGAHVLDVVVYNWPAFVADPSILLDPRRGLSSHGGAVGVVSAGLIYARLFRVDFHRMADGIMIAAVWLFPFIRVGNFINSEVVGMPTDLPWGVIFDDAGMVVPRHPSQLYEAMLGTSLIFVGLWLHYRHRHHLRKGATFYLMLGSYFAVRFLLEFAKERQAIGAQFPLNMGQVLSLPGALICGAMLWRRRPVIVSPGDPDASDPRPVGATAPIGQPEPATAGSEP